MYLINVLNPPTPESERVQVAAAETASVSCSIQAGLPDGCNPTVNL